MRKVFLAIALFALFLAPAPGVAQSGAKVTIAARRMTLAALVRKLARQSGLTLDVDPADPLSATPLLAYLTDVRADAAATALADLLSTRRAAWRWERLADKPGDSEIHPANFKPGVAYRLRPSSGAKVYAAKARARILQDLAGTIASSGGAAGSDDDLAALAKDFQKAAAERPPMITSTETITKEQSDRFEAWFDKQRKANQRLAQMALARLSPADRERLMDGRAIRLPSERFDTPFADALRDAGELNGGGGQPFGFNHGTLTELTPDTSDPPTYAVYFDTNREAFAVAPWLNISVERAVVTHPPDNSYVRQSSSRAGIESLGAAANGRWRGVLTKEWTPDAPEVSAPQPDTLPLAALATHPEINADTPNDKYASFTDPLLRLHKTVTKNGKGLNILARLATFRGGASDPFADENIKTLGAARKALLEGRAMPTRWAASAGGASDAILLANSLTHIWTSGPDKLVAPKYRADFAAATRRDPHHLISLTLLCDAARRLGPDALYTLLAETDDEPEQEYGGKPETDLMKAMREGGSKEQFADFARKLHPLLALLGGNSTLRRRIQEEPGINLADPTETAVRDAWASCDSPIRVGIADDEPKGSSLSQSPTPITLRLYAVDENAGNQAVGEVTRQFRLNVATENGETTHTVEQRREPFSANVPLTAAP